MDADALARVLAEGTSIYDTVFDHDLGFIEQELLVEHISGGELDREALVESLLTSSEFTTRFDGQSDAAFVGLIFLNAYMRAPSMEELHDALERLAGGSISRAELVLEIDQSSEHKMTGNGHMLTNNFDVIMNPAQFERSLDIAYVELQVANLFDTVYNRAPTPYELEYYTDRLLNGTDVLEDVASMLLASVGAIAQIAQNSLHGLTGTDLIREAYRNATSRDPSPEELADWEMNLASGRLTPAAFVAALAQSLEHAADGNAPQLGSTTELIELIGTNGNDVLLGVGSRDNLYGYDGNDSFYGQEGDEVLVGGLSADRLNGEAGNDSLWGGTGDDVLVGGAGVDQFNFESGWMRMSFMASRTMWTQSSSAISTWLMHKTRSATLLRAATTLSSTSERGIH